MHLRNLLGVAIASAVLAALPASALAGATTAGANHAARGAADLWSDMHFDPLGPSAWRASCRHAGTRRWACRVSMRRHHCKGTLRLRERTSRDFNAYAYHIHCRG